MGLHLGTSKDHHAACSIPSVTYSKKWLWKPLVQDSCCSL